MPRDGLLSPRQSVQTAQMDPNESSLEDAEHDFEMGSIETVAEAFASDGGTWNEFVNDILGDDLNVLSEEEIQACKSHFQREIPMQQADPSYG